MKKFIALVLTVALIVPLMSINAISKTDWSNMFKDSAHTNYQPDAVIPDVMQRNWVYYPEGNRIFSHVAKDDRIYLGDSAGYIVCLDQSNGQEIWKYEIGGKGMISIGITKDKLSYICQIDNTPKKEEEGTPGGGGRGGPGGGGGGRHPMSVTEPISISADGDIGSIIGFISLENGAELFKDTVIEPEKIAAGLVTNDFIYLAYSKMDDDGTTGSSRIVCINPEDNTEVWTLTYDLMVQNLFTKGDDHLYISALEALIDEGNPMNSKVLDASIVALTLDGKIAWEKKLTDKQRVGMISYADGVIYYPFMQMPET
ncbi:MAG: PQQ-binding-like beta-propeller repeat protein, partial [Caldisericia bacterium]|nr:PQQ-binding-like beta-propeller repeat protein [Caldisericia bacterium]